METQDLQFRQIQAGNEQVRKKLQTFRSGLEKLMNKKTKKSSTHQLPSRDTKNPKNQLDNQYFSTNSGQQQSSPKISNTSKQIQFGFNSTLFRQIGNDSIVMSNNSGTNMGFTGNNFGSNYASNNYASNNYASNNYASNNYASNNYASNNYASNNYASNNYASNNNAGNYASNDANSSNKQYFSTQSKNSGGHPGKQDSNDQGFKNSFKLFSQIDDLMNKVNRTSKLPVKPIEKYFNKKQNHKNVTNLEDLDIDMSKSETKFDEDNYLQNKKEIKSNQKLKTIQEIEEQNKRKGQFSRQDIKSATKFIQSYKEKPQSISKNPPLPVASQSWYNDKKKKANQQKQRYKDTYDRQMLVNDQSQIDAYDRLREQNQTKKSPSNHSSFENSVQIHRTKIKQTLSERKKMMRQQGMQDDSIQLQLSSQQQENTNQKQIKALQTQKQLLLKELKQIEDQLERLDNE